MTLKFEWWGWRARKRLLLPELYRFQSFFNDVYIWQFRWGPITILRLSDK
jgi:hypothetical protein